MSTNEKRIIEIYEKASLIDFIEYVQIFPHRIHYASEIYYIKDEKFKCICPNSKDTITININAPDDIISIRHLFDTIKAKKNNYIFVNFNEKIDNGSIFDVVRNISNILSHL